MANNTTTKRSITQKEWEDIVDEVDILFPKGISKDRGKAIVLIAKILIILKLKR